MNTKIGLLKNEWISRIGRLQAATASAEGCEIEHCPLCGVWEERYAEIGDPRQPELIKPLYICAVDGTFSS